MSGLCLVLRLRQDKKYVVVTLSGPGRELPWLRLRGLFGSEGDVRRDQIAVRVDRLLALAHSLRVVCERFGLRLDLDEGTRLLLRGIQDLRGEMSAVYDRGLAGAEVDVPGRLAGGRFTRRLTGFQIRDVGHLLGLPHGANFSVPGAGKTSVTYAVHEAERLTGRVERLLVVGPLSAFDAWISEAAECFSSIPRIGVFE